MKAEHEKELRTLKVSNITDSLNHLYCALLGRRVQGGSLEPPFWPP